MTLVSQARVERTKGDSEITRQAVKAYRETMARATKVKEETVASSEVEAENVYNKTLDHALSAYEEATRRKAKTEVRPKGSS